MTVRPVAKDLTHLLVRNPAVVFEPVPRAAFREPQLFKPSHHRLAGYAERVRENNDLTTGEAGGAGGYLAKFLHHTASRRPESPARRDRIPLFTRFFGHTR